MFVHTPSDAEALELANALARLSTHAVHLHVRNPLIWAGDVLRRYEGELCFAFQPKDALFRTHAGSGWEAREGGIRIALDTIRDYESLRLELHAAD